MLSVLFLDKYGPDNQYSRLLIKTCFVCLSRSSVFLAYTTLFASDYVRIVENYCKQWFCAEIIGSILAPPSGKTVTARGVVSTPVDSPFF